MSQLTAGHGGCGKGHLSGIQRPWSRCVSPLLLHNNHARLSGLQQQSSYYYSPVYRLAGYLFQSEPLRSLLGSLVHLGSPNRSPSAGRLKVVSNTCLVGGWLVAGCLSSLPHGLSFSKRPAQGLSIAREGVVVPLDACMWSLHNVTSTASFWSQKSPVQPA